MPSQPGSDRTPPRPPTARTARIVLGVGGGIAAYKACSLLRLFTEAGHDVTVVPTASALRFVGAPTWEALSGKPVHTDVWSDVPQVPHVRLGQSADLVVVAPATADLLAKAAHGLADDLLTNVLLTARCPVVMAPAMHTEMWDHAATQANVSTLTERGVHIIPPASGRLTGADTGPGRLPDPDDLYAVCARILAHGTAAVDHAVRQDGIPGDHPTGPLRGRTVVVTAGGTREPLDPVRFLGNRSSGKQGYAVARIAARRGADVVLISANTELTAPPGVVVVPVQTALDLQEAVEKAATDADVVVMAAAVADFRPAHYLDAKIKKSHDPADPDAAPTIALVRNPDILARLVESRGEEANPVIVGFAAETGDDQGSVLDHGRDKLARKGCDLLVVNEVGADKTFGQDVNTVHILRQGSSHVVDAGPATKDEIAAAVWDAVQEIL
ncbi:bifunctional phosphopantothenoylcysteine decarboxylase/phosphopantothenate--cysteine ligase CoaBC [Nostocoides sp. HKS02]|uniref:bifunctional phosphopantothenoylcysteine decarboxylase/phosphopantothenate--cysteine ligase CoaBC n=1 Tax=Nostocoides sp. HKS02 TaxID=1813880 RepID=UPI0012B4B289|nr:bifunctional phosphopantothenoylcysteine decarboxylase/phosphopantothenate--cysteine ligase CoaBC [Tetrasphaera sp. HKS02]QGN57108.1 bifunctional phosphopantothenoylcysteine decarboxylase/phosphopantothenate--cysteine ligase CoaBC [Tetrasphaera sp. HKS02]